MGQPGNITINRLGLTNFWHFNTVTKQSLQGSFSFISLNIAIITKLFFKEGLFFFYKFLLNSTFLNSYPKFRVESRRLRFRFYKIMRKRIQYGSLWVYRTRRPKTFRFFSRVWFLTKSNWLLIKLFIYNPGLKEVKKVKLFTLFF